MNGTYFFLTCCDGIGYVVCLSPMTKVVEEISVKYCIYRINPVTRERTALSLIGPKGQ